MRIAFIGQKGIPAVSGGIERNVEDTAVRLASAGHEVTVYTRPWYTPAEQTEHAGVRLVSITSLHTKHLDAISHTLFSTLHALRQRYDVIHYHGVGPSLLAWVPRLCTPRTRVVATFHCIDRKHQKWGRIAQFFLAFGEWAACRFPHTTIATSRMLQHYCSQVYGRETVFVPYGVARQPVATTTSTLSQFGLVPGQYAVIVSRLVRHKSIHVAIDAVRQLPGNFQLAIVGDGAFTDDYVAELKSRAAGDARIVFTGAQTGSALRELVDQAYAVIHPSVSEGMSISLLEALVAGKATVVADVPENLETIGDAGLAFQSGNATDLAAKLQSLIDRPALAAELGARGVRRASDRHDWAQIIPLVVAAYDRPALFTGVAAQTELPVRS